MVASIVRTHERTLCRRGVLLRQGVRALVVGSAAYCFCAQAHAWCVRDRTNFPTLSFMRAVAGTLPAHAAPVKRIDADVIIIGGGDAVLSAERALVVADVRVVLLEARDRIGGRILTTRDARLTIPIELGAEFIHGSAPETVAIAREAGIRTYEVLGERWRAGNGQVRRVDDYWKRLDLVMRRLDPELAPDRSFQEFLAARPGGSKLSRERTLAAEFVQGFHAADLQRISARSLAEGGSLGVDPDERRMARLFAGYDRVPQW